MQHFTFDDYAYFKDGWTKLKDEQDELLRHCNNLQEKTSELEKKVEIANYKKKFDLVSADGKIVNSVNIEKYDLLIALNMDLRAKKE